MERNIFKLKPTIWYGRQHVSRADLADKTAEIGRKAARLRKAAGYIDEDEADNNGRQMMLPFENMRVDRD